MKLENLVFLLTILTLKTTFNQAVLTKNRIYSKIVTDLELHFLQLKTYTIIKCKQLVKRFTRMGIQS
jgi:hypothetical protein